MNVFTHTIETRKGEVYKTVQVTREIKQAQSFAMMFASRLTWMPDASFDVSSDTSKKVDLGNWDGHKFTPVIAVFVGPADQEFTASNGHPAQARVVTIPFQHFNVGLAWSFISLPGDQSGHTVNITTLEGMVKYVSAEGARDDLEMFDLARDQILREYVVLLGKMFHELDPNHPSPDPFLQNATYFASGEATPEWEAWMRSVVDPMNNRQRERYMGEY